MRLAASLLSANSGPLFISSLDCSDGDRSLINDCSHDQLGLGSCDTDDGLAAAKCFGE